MNKKTIWLLTLVISSLNMVTTMAKSQTLNSQEQIAKSDLVFLGTVKKVSYAMSAGEPGIPHTFVTYIVDQVIQGSFNEKEVVLRFIGGRSGEANFMMFSGLPLFDVEDQDILMVAKNGTAGCPLVDCADGRFRVIGGKIFDEEGRAIERNASGKIYKAGYYELTEVMTHQASTVKLVKRNVSGPSESRQEFVAPGRGDHIDKDTWLRELKEEARLVGRATPRQFKNADPSKIFSISMSHVAPIDPVKERQLGPTIMTLQEAEEREAFLSNGGNPVISTNRNANTKNENQGGK